MVVKVLKLFIALVIFSLAFNILSIVRWQIHIEVKSVQYLDNYYKLSDNDEFITYIKQLKQQQNSAKQDGQKIQVRSHRGQSFLNDLLNERGFINVYYYADICHLQQGTSQVFWNVLFPRFPSEVGKLNNFYDDNTITGKLQTRRMIGLLHPNTTDWYQFEIDSRMGCEMKLIEHKLFEKSHVYDQFLLNFGVSEKQIAKEENPKEPTGKAFTVQSKPVKLHKHLVYMINIIHVAPSNGFFRLKWRLKKTGGKSFKKIPSELLATLYKKPTVFDKLPNITFEYPITDRLKLKQNDQRNNFHEIPISVSVKSTNTCDYTASYIPETFPPDTGVAYVKVDKLYPENKLIEHHHKGGYYDLYINKEVVHKVLRKFMKLVGSSYTLRRIVHMEENKETKGGKRYFIEIDVTKHGSEQMYRFNGWVVMDDKSSELCTPIGYEWNTKETIYLVTPVKNQAKWIRYLVYSINEIVERTKEQNIHLMLYDFDSKDANIEHDILQQANFKYSYKLLHGKFSKVIGLNRAVSAIEEEDPLIFVLDLQLQIPLFLFDYVRKHTFRGRTTYVPICMRLACGEHPEFTKLTSGSIWQEIGYGMISIFKSDWLRIGGMNETRFSSQWGGEDWEFVDRVLSNKMEVIHHRLPGYYHIYHSTKGTWDGTKEF